MAKKEKPKAVVKEHKDPDVKEFDYGTIMLICKCGRKQTLMEHVEHGIQFILATNDKAGLTLHCDECHSELRLYCEEGTPPPEPETKPVIESITVEEVPEAVDDTEEIKEASDEDIPKESKEGESV